MSGSSRPKPGCFGSDIRRLLLAAEAGQKADILTYSSGHLGPRGLDRRAQRVDTKQQSLWRTSRSPEETPGPLTVRQRRTKTLTVRESLSSALTASTEVSEPGRGRAADHSSRADGRGDVRPRTVVRRASNSVPSQQRAFSQKKPNSSSVPEGKQQLCSSHSDQEGRNNEDRLKTKQWFDREFVAKQDLRAGRSVAEMHERKLQKELRKLSAQSWPSRDRLAVFSDVFDDVCESSPVFGRILREIKHVEMEQPLDPSHEVSGSRSPETDYDLYVNHMMASQSPPHDMSPNTSLEDLGNVKVTEMELEDAEKEVHRLEQEARRALQENKRVRNESQNVPALAGPGDSDMKRPRDAGTSTSSTNSVQLKRLQVLNTWRDIQQLEEEINQKLVCTVATAATEKHIKVLKAEALRLIASNDRLKTTNENLENKINMVLNREKSSKNTRRTLWDEIQCDPQTESEELHQRV